MRPSHAAARKRTYCLPSHNGRYGRYALPQQRAGRFRRFQRENAVERMHAERGITFALLHGERRAMVRGRKQTRKGEGHVTQNCSSRPHGDRTWCRGSAYAQEASDAPALVEVTYNACWCRIFRFEGRQTELWQLRIRHGGHVQSQSLHRRRRRGRRDARHDVRSSIG